MPCLGKGSVPPGQEDPPCRTWENTALSSALCSSYKEKAQMVSSLPPHTYNLWMQNF